MTSQPIDGEYPDRPGPEPWQRGRSHPQGRGWADKGPAAGGRLEAKFGYGLPVWEPADPGCHASALGPPGMGATTSWAT